MTLLLWIITLWLVTAILGYIFVSIHSDDWHFNEKDLVLLFPIVNIVVFGLILIILFDEFIFGIRE